MVSFFAQEDQGLPFCVVTEQGFRSGHCRRRTIKDESQRATERLTFFDVTVHATVAQLDLPFVHTQGEDYFVDAVVSFSFSRKCVQTYK